MEESRYVAIITGMNLSEEIQALTRFYTDGWWASPTSFPQFQRSYSTSDLNRNDRELQRVSDLVMKKLEQMPRDEAGQVEVRERLLEAVKPFVRNTLGLKEAHLDLILRSGFVDTSAEFAREALKYDPTLTDADIYQASRNVMSMNFMQLLLGLPVRLTPSVFAYSLLYPYSDNILDDPRIPAHDKTSFGIWFKDVLMNEDPPPRSDRERRIKEMIGLVENEFGRAKFPRVYESMLGIHSAQARSMEIVQLKKSPYEADVLGLSFEKGGASVLGDGYLVAGDLTAQQRKFMFGYGCFTQLMDDVEDIQSDHAGGIATIFSQCAGSWALDGMTNRLFHFGEAVFGQMDQFSGKDAQNLRELVWICIQPALIGSLIASHKYYSPGYLRDLQQHFPFHFRTMDKLQKKLRRRGFSITRMVMAAGYVPGEEIGKTWSFPLTDK
jgi:hypothetical protein